MVILTHTHTDLSTRDNVYAAHINQRLVKQGRNLCLPAPLHPGATTELDPEEKVPFAGYALAMSAIFIPLKEFVGCNKETINTKETLLQVASMFHAFVIGRL